MLNLGGLYLNGWGVAQDYQQARQWYEKAAAAGSAEAMENLGKLYLGGVGVAEDKAIARQWFEKAAAGGNDEAKLKLKAQ
jgi:TPR repeat protein